ncbi:hypothetical protein ACIRP0_20860 [Streptomyces sp. NPDC101733]|uniref:hypothetical protein n=1 Tax=unclassified Streptomyces TaxID=2593676 RepID=UPI00380BFFE1
MTAYAMAHLRPATMNEDILRYVEETQSTLDPVGGSFPDMERARAGTPRPPTRPSFPRGPATSRGEAVRTPRRRPPTRAPGRDSDPAHRAARVIDRPGRPAGPAAGERRACALR